MYREKLNSIPDLTFNTKELLALYMNKEYDKVSSKLLNILGHFLNITYSNLSYNEQLFINTFIDTFLYIFSRADYALTREYAETFIKLNPVIANLVAISCYKTTDIHIELLKHQPDNFFKILALYSSRNKVKIPAKMLFDTNYSFASIWYFYYFMIDSFPSELMNANIIKHINNMDNRLEIPTTNISGAYFGATYCDIENDKKVKGKINSLIRKVFTVNIKNRPSKNRIAIITEKWIRNHSVYRSFYKNIELLMNDYAVDLIHLGKEMRNISINNFKNVKNIAIRKEKDKLKMDLATIADNDYSLVFYPDIGMNAESIYLSNLRIAPVQVTGYGHPVSTHGSEIDYFIGGMDVELPEYAENNYSERLVLIPGLGVYPTYPDYTRQNIIKKTDDFIINCTWTANKVNSRMIENLQAIIKASHKKILFRFFPGSGLDMANGFLPFKYEIESALGKENVKIFIDTGYVKYMSSIEEGDLTIDSFPFGGYNTIIDSLHTGTPVVTYEGTKAYNRLASALLKRLDLNELIVHNNDEYIDKILNIINNDAYRSEINNKTGQLNLNYKIFSTDEPDYFKKAIDYLILNHEQLKYENSRKPIIIKSMFR